MKQMFSDRHYLKCDLVGSYAERKEQHDASNPVVCLNPFTRLQSRPNISGQTKKFARK